MIINRRILRELKKCFLQYFTIFLLVVFCMFLLIGLAGSCISILHTVESGNERNNCEDGEFILNYSMKEDDLNGLRELGIDVEEEFYFNVKLDTETTLRIFQNRQSINLIDVKEGAKSAEKNEIFLEKNYAQKNGFSIDSEIKLFDKEYKVVGTGSVPDYNFVKENVADVAADTAKFSLAFVTPEEFEALSKKSDQIFYNYSYCNQEGKDVSAADIKEYLLNIENDVVEKQFAIYSFVESENNPRLNDYKEDVLVNRNASIVIGVVIIILIAYILAIFVYNTIEREEAIIGTLYAQGYVKKELMFHYIMLPVSITVLGSIVGTIVGFMSMSIFADGNVSYYSYPNLEYVYSPFLIAYGICVPIVLSTIINIIMIHKKLSQTPLSLLKKEKKIEMGENISLEKMSFVNRYRIRQLIREKRANIVMFFGLCVATFFLVFSFCIHFSLVRYAEKIDKDIHYSYMYSLKSPLAEEYEDAEKAVIINYNCYNKMADSDLKVSMLGIEDDNPYFDYDLSCQKDEIVISNSVSLKFNLKKGDILVLSDQNEPKKYAYSIVDIVEYANGLFVFRNIDDMREDVGLPDNYYNVLFSDEEYDIPDGYLITKTSREDIVNTADSFVSLIRSFVVILLVVSIVLFTLVMYMLMKIIIERSRFSVSLIKIFGYNEKEVRKLYLGTTFYIVAISTVIGIIISRLLLIKIYPFLVSNLSSGMETYIPAWGIAVIVGIIFVEYFIVYGLLSTKLKRVEFTEILKSRE